MILDWELKAFNLETLARRKIQVTGDWVRQQLYQWTGFTPKPRRIYLDPTNSCNLACPLCPTGSHSLGEPRNYFKLEDVDDTLDQIPTLKEISLFNWGEPLLHPSLPKMVAKIRSRGVRVILHSHLSLRKSPDYFEALLKAGPWEIFASIDGATPESYLRYRKNGDFDLVMSNLETLAAIKHRLGLKRPRLIWKMIVNRYNEEEIPLARKRARDLGVLFQLATIHLGDYSPDMDLGTSLEDRKEEWLPVNQKFVKEHLRHSRLRNPIRKGKCPYLFSEPVINPNRKVYPCCHVTQEQNAFGDLHRESFGEIWTNGSFLNARRRFTRKGDTRYEPDQNLACDRCQLYRP